jgi:cytochrome oxidase assembly protein ShyY1
MLRGYSFRSRRIRLRYAPLALAALGIAAGIALGNWQARRAADKVAAAEALATALASAPLALAASPASAAAQVGRHVAASGRFVAERTVYLANRNRGARPGYEVVTPLALSPQHAVLVQRGWVAREALEAVRTPEGEQRIDGIALARLPRAYAVSAEESGALRQNLEIDAYAKETGLALEPVVIQQHNDNGDGLARDWPKPDFGVDMHRAYALQWYSLAGLSGVLGLAFGIRRVAQG